MAEIEWHDYKSGLPPVTDADLDILEEVRGVTLPPDYRSTVKAHYGQIPEPSVADVGEARIPVNALFFVKQHFEGDDFSYNAWHYIEALEEDLPPGVAGKLVPFTSDSSQGIFVFDYRLGPDPSVALVDLGVTEDEGAGAITQVAGSFAAFLDGLHD